MKRVLLVLGILVVALIAAAGIFIATFDVDRYRPMIVAKLEAATGKPVRIGHLSLGWNGGIAVQARQIALLDGPDAAQPPLIQAEAVSVLVELAPLLRRDVRVSSFVLQHPVIEVRRDAQGRINLLGLAVAAAPAAAPGQSAAAPSTPLRAASRAESRDAAPAPVSLRISSIRVEQGAVHWVDEAVHPAMDVWLKTMTLTVQPVIPGRPMAVNLSAGLGQERPNLRLTGQVTLPDASQSPARPASHEAGGGKVEGLHLSLERIAVEQLFTPPAAGEPQLRGLVTVAWDGALPTLAPDQLLKQLSAHGRLQVEQPIIANLNLLRVVFERISMLPGLMQALESRLPPNYQAKLAATDTVLQPVELAFTVEQGLLRFQDVALATETVRVTGAGQVGMDGQLVISSRLRIEPELSAALIKSVGELEGLANPQGELELPLAIQGQLPRVSVIPDLNYVASKLLATKAQDLISDLLKRLVPDEPSSTPPSQ